MSLLWRRFKYICYVQFHYPPYPKFPMPPKRREDTK